MVNTPLVSSSTNGISFAGLASGLNSSELISSLVAFESAAIKQPLLNKKSLLQAKLSALESFATKLSALKTKAQTLGTTPEFLSNTASSSNGTVITATADGSALEGTHQITVTQIARAETEVHANAFLNYDTTSAGTGTITINYAGTDHVVTITDGTLNGIATAINSAAIGVKASVVNVTTTGTPSYKLFFQGDEVGDANDIVVTNNLSGGSSLGAFSDLVDATNATFTYGSLVGLVRTSNTISDLIPGVTINLLKEDATAVTITVNKDSSKIVSKIQALVSAFNDAATFIKSQKTFKQGTTPSVLFGDLAINLASNKLASIISGVQNTSNPDFANLSQIGITSKTDGTLSVDTTKLEDAIDDDPQAVAKLFATGLTGGGVAVQLEEWLDDFLSTATTGLIQAEKDSANDTIKGLDDQILKADLRLTKFQDGLTRKYSALEALMSKLQAQQSFLGSVQF